MSFIKPILPVIVIVSLGGLSGLIIRLVPNLPPWVSVFESALFVGLMAAVFMRVQSRRHKFLITQMNEEAQFKTGILRFVTESQSLTTRKEFYRLILQTAVAAIPHAATGSLMRITADGFAQFEDALGHDMAHLESIKFKLEETFLYILSNGKCDRTVIVNDYQALNRKVLDSDRFSKLEAGTLNISQSSIMSAPIFLDGVLWGTLTVESVASYPFQEDHIEKLNVFVGETVNILKFMREQEKTHWLMNHDPQTGLLNRRAFVEKLKLELESVRISASFGTLVLMDLDSFKSINDVHGHNSGDKALIHFSSIFQMFLNSSDYFSRYGGDEFVAVFPFRAEAETRDIITKIEQAFVENPLCLGNHCEVIRFSYGIVVFDKEFCEHTQIMRTADELMYEHKRTHKKAYQVDTTSLLSDINI